MCFIQFYLYNDEHFNTNQAFAHAPPAPLLRYVSHPSKSPMPMSLTDTFLLSNKKTIHFLYILRFSIRDTYTVSERDVYTVSKISHFSKCKFLNKLYRYLHTHKCVCVYKVKIVKT